MSSVEQVKVVARIPCQWKLRPSYYHSFGITENYFVFVEQPFVLNLKKFLLNAILDKSLLSSLEWCSNEKVRDVSVNTAHHCHNYNHLPLPPSLPLPSLPPTPPIVLLHNTPSY